MRQTTIRTITKKQLCDVFGLVSPRGQYYYSRLKKEYFDLEALNELSMTEERYNSIRGQSFTYFETQRICALFKILPEDLEPESKPKGRGAASAS